MSKKHKVILFDFFDVIHRDHQKAWLAANGYKREGEFAAASDDLDDGTITLEEYFERYAAAHNSSVDRIKAEFEEFHILDHDMVGLLESLQDSDYQTGLISNAHTDEIEPLLVKHGLRRLFDLVIISSEVSVAKPHPDIFHMALERLNVAPGEAVFIDDNPSNVASSQEIGIDSILFTSHKELLAKLKELGLNV